MAKGNFAECETFTLYWEGPFSNDAHDPGGATNLGIVQSEYDPFRRAKGLPVRSVRFITHAEATEIYKTKYWTPIGAEDLPAGVDLLAFEIFVNGGHAQRWLLQTSNTAPVDRIHALDAYRRGYWKSLKIFRYFGRGWMSRENAALKLALQMAGEAQASDTPPSVQFPMSLLGGAGPLSVRQR